MTTPAAAAAEAAAAAAAGQQKNENFLFAKSLPIDLTPKSKPFTITLRENESLTIER